MPTFFCRFTSSAELFSNGRSQDSARESLPICGLWLYNPMVPHLFLSLGLVPEVIPGEAWDFSSKWFLFSFQMSEKVRNLCFVHPKPWWMLEGSEFIPITSSWIRGIHSSLGHQTLQKPNCLLKVACLLSWALFLELSVSWMHRLIRRPRKMILLCFVPPSGLNHGQVAKSAPLLFCVKWLECGQLKSIKTKLLRKGFDLLKPEEKSKKQLCAIAWSFLETREIVLAGNAKCLFATCELFPDVWWIVHVASCSL